MIKATSTSLVETSPPPPLAASHGAVEEEEEEERARLLKGWVSREWPQNLYKNVSVQGNTLNVLGAFAKGFNQHS